MAGEVGSAEWWAAGAFGGTVAQTGVMGAGALWDLATAWTGQTPAATAADALGIDDTLDAVGDALDGPADAVQEVARAATLWGWAALGLVGILAVRQLWGGR